jgi:hypothetical protein
MAGRNAHELVLLDQAGQALAEARSLDEIKTIRDKAEAVRKYAQSASLGLDVQNRAAEVKLRAERQAGKLLGQMMLRGGDRRSKSHCDRLKLDDLGLTANQSKRWQLQARVPEDVFREHIKQTCDDKKELTSAGLMRLAKRLKHEAVVVNGHSATTNRSSADCRGVEVAEYLAARRSGTTDKKAPASEFGEIVEELRNHHDVLDGILRSVYGGESASLRPAELRMVRYLMSEMGHLLARLAIPERGVLGRTCRNGRAAS